MGLLGTVTWWKGDTCGFPQVGRYTDREVRDIGRQGKLLLAGHVRGAYRPVF